MNNTANHSSTGQYIQHIADLKDYKGYIEVGQAQEVKDVKHLNTTVQGHQEQRQDQHHNNQSKQPTLSPPTVEQKQIQFQVATPAASNQKLRLHQISSQSHSPEVEHKKFERDNRSPPLSEFPAFTPQILAPVSNYILPIPAGFDCTSPNYPSQQKRQNSLSNYMVTSKRANAVGQQPSDQNQQPSQGNNNQQVNQGQFVQGFGQTPVIMSYTQGQPQGGPQGLQGQQTIGNNFQQGEYYPFSTEPSPIPSNGPSSRNAVRARRVNNPIQHGTKNTPTSTAYDLPSSPANQGNSDLSESNVPIESDAGYQQYQYQQFLQQQQQVQQAQEAHAQAQAEAEATQAAQVAAQAAAQAAQRAMSDEEQQLATKLKETYKNIVNFEELVQKHCIEITVKINQINGYGNEAFSNGSESMSQSTSELSNDLWTVYHHNITLLDNYSDFLVTALKPSSNQTHFKTGKNIVDLYKIPRRMWVYGIVGYLEVLKNIMGIFQDHEICSCFILHCFNIVSNLTDPALEMEGWWLEKLGDLSRMAIALYSLKFIDWKTSAEYWYSAAMKTLYGHGKVYYHMCTVQQDNLDALVNIGKSVVCRDPFVPTQQYLRLVVENICTQRNVLSLLELPIIDFIKIHKVLLSIFSRSGTNSGASAITAASNAPGYNLDPQLQYGINLVTRYGLTFGSDSTGYNFFTRELYTQSGITPINDPSHPYFHPGKPILHSTEKFNFWFNKGSLFALANINHLIGFGDAKNPFAKVFLLPEALRERKDKKDRKRKSIDKTGETAPCGSASDSASPDWFYSLQQINKSVLELSMRILNHYLIGPKQASTSHVIVWLYFLIAVGEATKKFPESQPMFDWLFKKLFPWESFINYLNNVLGVVRSSEKLRTRCAEYTKIDYLKHFSENETLPEVWKCWGTLWFDAIVEKGDYVDLEASGVKDSNMFDMPICGAYPIDYGNEQKSTVKLESENDERAIRIVLLARLLAENYSYGLVRADDSFKFDEDAYRTERGRDANMEEFLLGDGRFVQNGFLQAISFGNLCIGGGSSAADALWFEMAPQSSAADYPDSYTPDYYQEQYRQNRSESLGQRSESMQLRSESMGLVTTTPGLTGDLGDRMDSSLTHITLDTNIWLKHCGRIFKCVRHGVFKILIPLIVFQELRTLRKSTEATISDAATRSVIIIRELYFAKEIVPLRFDGTIALDINETFEFENSSNWRSNVDETILNCVNEHDELGRKQAIGLDAKISARKFATGAGLHDSIMISPSEELPVEAVLNAQTARMFRYCILITDDRNMRLRAKAIGLSSFQSRWLFSQLDGLFPFKCID